MGKRDHIIQVASEIVHLKGFNSTSLDDVLQRSGVKKGNFYFYFKSKEELGFAVLEYQMEQLRREFLFPILESRDAPHEKLLRILDLMETGQSRANCHGGCPFGNMALELSDVHEGFRTRLQEVFAEIVDTFYQLLQDASSEFREDVNLHDVSQLIVAALEGGILLSKVHKSIAPLRQCMCQLKSYLATLRCGPDAPGRRDVALGGAPQ